MELKSRYRIVFGVLKVKFAAFKKWFKKKSIALILLPRHLRQSRDFLIQRTYFLKIIWVVAFLDK